jgi:hypothetical protein
MGRAIFYCYKCSVLLKEADFEKGLAFRSGDRVACAACMPEAPPKLQSTRAIPAARKLESTTRTRMVQSPSPGGRKGILIGGGIGATMVVVGILFFVLRGQPEPAPAPDPSPVPAPPRTTATPPKTLETPKVNTREEEAQAAFRKAEGLPPEDFSAQIRAFDDIVWKFEGTKSAEEARKRVEAVKGKLREAVKAAGTAIDGEVRPRLEREEFGAALAEIEKGRAKFEAPEWRIELDRRVREVHDRARPVFDGLKAKAAEAKGKGDAPGVEQIVAKVRAWGVARYDDELKAELDAVAVKVDAPAPGPAVPVEKPPATAEGKAYRATWEEAVARAASRQYDATLAALRKAAGSLQEEEVRKQAAADQDDLQKVAAFYAGLLAELSKVPRYRGLSIETRSADGVRKSSGLVLQADADRVELRAGKETVFVEWSDATASSLAALSKADARTRALFCLLEGEVEAAQALFADVPAKYLTVAPALKGKILRPPAEEVRARELLYQAEREWRSMETRGPSAEKYRSLKNEFAATSTVGKLLPRILRRSEGGREYFFAGADLPGEGTFKRQKDGRLVSARDSEGREILENTAEFGFYVLPNTTYRAWVQLGGCCDVVFTAYWQASELTDTDPQTKKKIGVEPGALAVAPLKLWIRNVKKSHDHKKEPKSPARWEWVELPLPRFTSPGPKRVRILTDQAGFGVGPVVVSSTRKLAPTEAELKELEAARAAELPPEPPPDPDLLGYWSFDEGSGGESMDLSGRGRGAKLTGTQWVDGKVGKAIAFDGNGGKGEVADAPELRVTGNFTIAFWARKDAEVGDWVRFVGKSTEPERTFGIWEWPKDDRRIKFQQTGPGAWFDLDSTKPMELGVWTHIAAVVDGNVARLYLNGAKDGEKARPWAAATATDAPLTFGHFPLHAAYKGALDEIRLYSRALTDDEIRALYEGGR